MQDPTNKLEKDTQITYNNGHITGRSKNESKR